MKFIAENSLEILIKAIKLAGADRIDSIEVSMRDLIIMVEHIEDLEADVEALIDSKHKLSISLANSELRSLERPIKLDIYS